MDKESIKVIIKQLTAPERVQFIELLNESVQMDKISSIANMLIKIGK